MIFKSLFFQHSVQGTKIHTFLLFHAPPAMNAFISPSLGIIGNLDLQANLKLMILSKIFNPLPPRLTLFQAVIFLRERDIGITCRDKIFTKLTSLTPATHQTPPGTIYFSVSI